MVLRPDFWEVWFIGQLVTMLWHRHLYGDWEVRGFKVYARVCIICPSMVGLGCAPVWKFGLQFHPGYIEAKNEKVNKLLIKFHEETQKCHEMPHLFSSVSLDYSCVPAERTIGSAIIPLSSMWWPLSNGKHGPTVLTLEYHRTLPLKLERHDPFCLENHVVPVAWSSSSRSFQRFLCTWWSCS